MKANLEIFEARGLIGKDISGNSDPFCTFYLTTNPLARYNTSYKARTLNPVLTTIRKDRKFKRKSKINFLLLNNFNNFNFSGMERGFCFVSIAR